MCADGDKSNPFKRLACFRALCCKGPPPPRPEYDLVCIGLTGSGKTSLLSQLCGESPENIVSTTGFSIKAVPFQNAILNVKELGDLSHKHKESACSVVLFEPSLKTECVECVAGVKWLTSGMCEFLAAQKRETGIVFLTAVPS
ncbi:PREDICTED: ADP-ribosylation factor-like protein 15 [Mesitornis unicolor]|uniref:ADP-ribosylation factor-like protein 15 n=1 Tax=Mesitornis unicolor TaxID=54374 RepID=UPI0005291E28|nr:PREDICTED: ADP-ribosylation factor-like protein 15 [Mesitornis unicolor]